MKKIATIVILLAILAAGSWLAYRHFAAPTRIAFVNYMDFMYDAVVEANDNRFIHTEQVEMDEDTFKKAARFDAMYLFAHGGINLTEAQQADIDAAVAEGVEIISQNPMTGAQLVELDPEDVTYVTDCLTNGGVGNYRRMLNYTRKVFHGKRWFVDEITDPFILPDEYYYHLGDEEVFTEVGEYIQFLKDTGRYHENGKNVSLMATQFGASSDIGFINQLVNGLEARGYNVFPTVANGSHRLDFIRQANPNLVIYNAHGRFASDGGADLLKELNVPLLCPLVIFGPEEEWMESRQGLDGGLLSQSVTMPEIDGGAVPYVIGAQFKNERGLYVFQGIPHRIQNFLDLSEKWMALQDTPNAEKKIAVFYYKAAGKNAMVAEGLEIGPSLLALLERLKAEGYQTGKLPETADELVSLIQKKGPVFGQYAEGSIAEFANTGDPLLIGKTDLEAMLQAELHPELVGEMLARYGDAPGEYMTMTKDGEPYLMIPRVEFGNIVLIPVPPAGLGDDEVEIVHGVDMPPPYPYVGAYLWARTRFNADAIMHFGTHGSVEFTPGKQVALSDRDWPDALTAGTPHVYLYVINNIGEAMTAKRRSYAVMNSHLTAPLMESDVYGPLKALDDALERYWNTENPQMKRQYQKTIHDLVLEADLDQDMEFELVEGELIDDGEMKRLHHYLHEVEMAKVTKGLHVLGQPYTEDEVDSTLHLMALDSLVYNKVKMDQATGHVTEEELADANYMEKHYREPATTIINAVLLEGVDPLSFLTADQLAKLDSGKNSGSADTEHPDAMSGASSKPSTATGQSGHPGGMPGASESASTPEAQTGHPGGMPGGEAEATSEPELSAAEQEYLHALTEYRATLTSITRYHKNLVDSPERELGALVNSLAGGYTAPQSGGDPAFNPEAVPSGRNHYSINETKVPSKEAFEAAKELVDSLLEQQMAKTGKYPRKVAFSLWGSEFIRQEGITIAEIFYLLGVEPVRNARGTVHDLKLIPMEELGRPRIDVVVQTSGQFRDLAAGRIYLINRAVKLAAEAKDEEGEFENYVYDGVLAAEKTMKERGIAPAEARDLAAIRVFGGLNGGYGADIMGMVEKGDSWESEDEIAQRYLMTMGAMYGKEVWGLYKEGAFEGALQNAEMVVHPRSANTWGALSLDHVYEFMGGMSNVIRYVTGSDPDAWFSDLRSPDNPKVQSLEDAIWTEARTTVLNPKYIEGMQAEGPSGAETFAETFRNTYGWESMKTSAVDPELWDNLNRVYIDDIHGLGMEAYFREKNPYALQEMTAVMLEVVRKEYWAPDQAVVEKIATLHAELVKDHEAGCSGFVCDNAKLREMIARNVDKDLAEALENAVEKARTAQVSESVEGIELNETKDDTERQQPRQNRENEKSSQSMGIFIVLGFAVLVLGAATVVRRRRNR